MKTLTNKMKSKDPSTSKAETSKTKDDVDKGAALEESQNTDGVPSDGEQENVETYEQKTPNSSLQKSNKQTSINNETMLSSIKSENKAVDSDEQAIYDSLWIEIEKQEIPELPAVETMEASNIKQEAHELRNINSVPNSPPKTPSNIARSETKHERTSEETSVRTPSSQRKRQYVADETENTEIDSIKEEAYEPVNVKTPRMSPPKTPKHVRRSGSKCRRIATETSAVTPQKKRDHDIDETGSECTPTKQKKRKISLVSDYDQLSDVMKSELCDASTWADFEAIDMRHDLDTVMDFEHIKVTQDLVPQNEVSINPQNTDETAEEVCKDPLVDPLYIAETEKTKKIKKKTTGARYLTKKRTNITYRKPIRRVTKKSVAKRSAHSQPEKENVKEANQDKTNTTADKLDESDALDEPDKLCESKENAEFCIETREALENMEIRLIHSVPRQHQIEKSAGSRIPTLKEKKEFESHGPLRRGTFSPSEDEIIRQNWHTFCEIHHWDPKDVKPFLYMRHDNKFYIPKLKERLKFVQFLANGLPWRTLYSVHNRFRNLYEIRKKVHARYTAAEDKQILDHVRTKADDTKKANRIFSDLAKLLGRTRHSVRLRYQTLLKAKQSGEEKPLTNVEWTIPLINQFIKHLLNVTLSEDIQELKDATIPKPVWLKMEQKLDIDHGVLKTFWLHQLHMQLFCPHPIYLNDIKIQLIEYFYGKGISSTREIIWHNVAKYFEGITTIFLCKVFFHLVREVTEKNPTMEFPDIMEHLYHKKIRDIRNDVTDKHLPRLAYHNEKVEIVDEDADNYTDAE